MENFSRGLENYFHYSNLGAMLASVNYFSTNSRLLYGVLIIVHSRKTGACNSSRVSTISATVTKLEKVKKKFEPNTRNNMFELFINSLLLNCKQIITILYMSIVRIFFRTEYVSHFNHLPNRQHRYRVGAIKSFSHTYAKKCTNFTYLIGNQYTREVRTLACMKTMLQGQDKNTEKLSKGRKCPRNITS